MKPAAELTVRGEIGMTKGLCGRLAVLTSAAALAMGLAACGSSSSTSSSSGGLASSGASTSPVQNASATTGATQTAGAEAAVAPYLGHPSPFPVAEPLKSRIPAGTKIAFMDCGTPICGLFWKLLQPAAKTMGVSLVRYDAGSAATTVAAAYNAVVAAKPAAVIALAINIDLWKNQLKQLQAEHVPVVASGILGTAQYGIKDAQIAEYWSQLTGGLMADYIAAKFGSNSHVAFYAVPEISFTALMAQSFQSRLAKVCPSCSARVVQIPVAATGTTAPSMIVSDLQAHPDTNVIAFASDETEAGLPAALQTAGIHVKTLGSGPTPENLEYVKEGKETAVLAADDVVLSWTLLDQAARQIENQPLTGPEAQGVTVIQFLTQHDMTFNPSGGWVAYPDFVQRFAKLWKVAG
jgi:ribose transport system substrate-binding protein